MSDCAWCHEPVDCEHMAYVRDDERTYHDCCYPLALVRELDEAHAEIERLRARVEDYHRSLVAQSALLHTTSNERDEALAQSEARQQALIAEQKDEIERLRAEIALIKLEWQSADQWREQIHQAERERDEARALLREMEWGKPHIGYYDARGQERWSPTCRLCHKMRDDGHTPGCRLDAFLAGEVSR